MSGVPDAPPGEGESASSAGTVGGVSEFEELRRLLLPTELDRLGAVEQRLDDPEARAEDLSRVLPESIARAAQRDGRLGLALSGVLDEALGVSIKKHRKHLAEILSPAMGPAIRRAIAEALRATVDSFNQLLQYSLSARALRWRVEAWRTGRPFAEVLLAHSLVFRVEQVFLISRESGLLLLHAAVDPSLARDGDLVSGMLTAIQDFVRDSFTVDAGQAVDTMRVGDVAVWVEQGEKAYLAAVIRGAPPPSLRAVFRDALDALHLEFGEQLDAFSGDASPFEGARPHVEACLQSQVQAPSRGRHWVAPAAAAGIALLGLAAWGGFEVRGARRWNAYLARLAAEPGIVVVRESRGLRRATIEGLRDPDAVDPVRLLAGYDLDPGRVASRWAPYLSQAAAITLARARSSLQPPSTVTLTSDGAVLSAVGSAPHQWVQDATRRAASLPGVRRFDARRLTDEGVAALAEGRGALERVVLRFDPGSAELRGREAAEFDSVVAAFKRLSDAAAGAGVALQVEVTGHTDGTGSERTNVRLSRARAEWVLSALEARGLRSMRLVLAGVGTSEPLRDERGDEDRALNRSVTFRITVGEELPR